MSPANAPLVFSTPLKETPFFSICIPHHSRFDHLLVALDALRDQTERSFEVCISDDCSPERRHEDVVAFLGRHDIPHSYVVQPANLRYDGNLRAAMSLARGRFCLLMGNDDMLNGAGALERLRREIEQHAPAGVVITDFENYETGVRAGRIQRTGNYGSGPEVAVDHFRNFSFVSGILLDRANAHALATASWDGSEMYQMFIGCRIIATGQALLEIAEPLVRKDIRIPGAEVDSWMRLPRERGFAARTLTITALGRLVYDAVTPALTEHNRQPVIRRIFRQLFAITYPYWLLEYRRVQSWPYAFGIARGMNPSKAAQGVPATSRTRLEIWITYVASTVLALSVPIGLFSRMRNRLYHVVKRPAGPMQSAGGAPLVSVKDGA